MMQMVNACGESPGRDFFLHAGNDAVGATGALILGAANNSRRARPVLSEGARRYECIQHRKDLPAGIKYGNTQSACLGSQGNPRLEAGRSARIRHIS
jgi:hypothetical protein